MNDDQFSNAPKPTYEWIDRHSERVGDLQRAHGKDGGLWGIVPGLVYCGAIALLSTVLGTEIARLFAGQSALLQIIGWGCVVVVGLSAIASFYGKGAVYKSQRQQRLGMFFWALEIGALTIGFLVAVADAFGFTGWLLDVARFAGFMSVVVAASGWGILRWASPEWKVISEQNKSTADLSIKLAELDSQYAMSDEMIELRMLAAYQKARRSALAALQDVPQLPAPRPSTMQAGPDKKGFFASLFGKNAQVSSANDQPVPAPQVMASESPAPVAEAAPRQFDPTWKNLLGDAAHAGFQDAGLSPAPVAEPVAEKRGRGRPKK